MKKNGVNSVTRKCSGVCKIQLREKAIVESPAYVLVASAAFSTSGIGWAVGGRFIAAPYHVLKSSPFRAFGKDDD